MKKRKFKLNLNKESISKLNKGSMSNIKGGDVSMVVGVNCYPDTGSNNCSGEPTCPLDPPKWYEG